nr:hypothetical protein [Tanacetum cinerariifolium]
VKDSDKSADKGSDNTNEMANVLGTLGAANILASGGLSPREAVALCNRTSCTPLKTAMRTMVLDKGCLLIPRLLLYHFVSSASPSDSLVTVSSSLIVVSLNEIPSECSVSKLIRVLLLLRLLFFFPVHQEFHQLLCQLVSQGSAQKGSTDSSYPSDWINLINSGTSGICVKSWLFCCGETYSIDCGSESESIKDWLMFRSVSQ